MGFYGSRRTLLSYAHSIFFPQENYAMYLNRVKIVQKSDELNTTEMFFTYYQHDLVFKRATNLHATSSTDEHVFLWKFLLNVPHSDS